MTHALCVMYGLLMEPYFHNNKVSKTIVSASVLYIDGIY